MQAHFNHQMPALNVYFCQSLKTCYYDLWKFYRFWQTSEVPNVIATDVRGIVRTPYPTVDRASLPIISQGHKGQSTWAALSVDSQFS